VLGGFVAMGIVGLFVGAIVFSVGYKLFLAWINGRPANQQTPRFAHRSRLAAMQPSPRASIWPCHKQRQNAPLRNVAQPKLLDRLVELSAANKAIQDYD